MVGCAVHRRRMLLRPSEKRGGCFYCKEAGALWSLVWASKITWDAAHPAEDGKCLVPLAGMGRLRPSASRVRFRGAQRSHASRDRRNWLTISAANHWLSRTHREDERGSREISALFFKVFAGAVNRIWNKENWNRPRCLLIDALLPAACSSENRSPRLMLPQC